MILRTAGAGELRPRDLYAILRLRSAVFVVEQQSVYLDLDGDDLIPDTRHSWIEGDTGDVLAYLRILGRDDGGSKIGRVVTAPAVRGQGLGARLMRHAVALAEPPVHLHAQAYLQQWYEQFGFEVVGPPFTYDDEGDRILHVPMLLR